MAHASGNDQHTHTITSPHLAHRATIPRSQSGLRRYKTLNRPHLAHPPSPLVHPPRKLSKFDPWRIYSHIITFWAPDFLLRRCGRRMKSAVVRQAWREKIALFAIAIVLWGFVAFYTLFMRQIMCPASTLAAASNQLYFNDQSGISFGDG
jgi:chitin synthase